MKAQVSLCVLLAALAASAGGGSLVVTNVYGGVPCVVNYDESRVAPYALEDPLTFVDGRRVKSAADWEARRAEILGIFAREMYGVEPPAPGVLNTDLVDEKVSCAGYAIRRQYRMTFTADRSGPVVNWIVWIPVAMFIHMFPTPLQIQLAGFANSFLCLVLLSLGKRK
jgi:hypothetical protein